MDFKLGKSRSLHVILAMIKDCASRLNYGLKILVTDGFQVYRNLNHTTKRFIFSLSVSIRMNPPWPPPIFHIMAKPSGPDCNLNCEYCFYLPKATLFPPGIHRMDEKVLKAFICQYIQAHHGPEITFGWQGGEPTLMGLKFFQQVISFQQKYARPGIQITNTFQTNGTMLTEEWGSFLKEYDFLVGISIDGPRKLHNAYRKDGAGHGSFDKVQQGLEILKRYKVRWNVLACVNAITATHPLEIYHFFRDELQVEFIQFIPIVEKVKDKEGKGIQISDRSVSGMQYGQFLITIFNEWVRKDVGKVFVQIFDVTLAAWLQQPAAICIFSQICGTALALEYNGDLYACDHFVSPGYLLGNILEKPLSELVGSTAQYQFGLSKSKELPIQCRKCPVVFACNGGCPKDRLLKTTEGESGLNYLCKGYYDFFTYVDPMMRFMANELIHHRPATNIMKSFTSKKNK